MFWWFVMILISNASLSLQVKPSSLNGTKVAPGDFPYLVAVFNAAYKPRTCGGILVADTLVLTAAYCLQDLTHDKLDLVSLLAGVTHVQDYKKRQWRYVIDTIPLKNKHLVLLRVDSEFFPNYRLHTWSPPREHLHGNIVCTLLGWGGNPLHTLGTNVIVLNEQLARRTCGGAFQNGTYCIVRDDEVAPMDAGVLVCAGADRDDRGDRLKVPRGITATDPNIVFDLYAYSA